ncbi:hypothetical protein [Corallococcus caeni]|uniref:GH16 domain-containing protein n=1 Tax=Corallococcus caeni TaxID=3082388 RepID=A0ABQ6QVU2_9BACT|nr:hypothetical protein ASNO1_41790 [Corallococcus sp. NO1]
MLAHWAHAASQQRVQARPHQHAHRAAGEVAPQDSRARHQSAGEGLLLNLAIGGSWGGQQGVDLTLFPHRMYVDYVRVYERM